MLPAEIGLDESSPYDAENREKITPHPDPPPSKGEGEGDELHAGAI